MEEALAPVECASTLSKLVFYWASKLIFLGKRRQLQLPDLYPLPREMPAAAVLAAFRAAWAKQQQQARPPPPLPRSPAQHGAEASLVWALFDMYRPEILHAWTLIALYAGFSLLGPAFFMQELILYAGGSFSVGYGIFLALGMMLSDTTRSFLAQHYWMAMYRCGVKYRSLMYTVVFSKALSLRDLGGYSVGELVNLSTNDGQRLAEACQNVVYVAVSALMFAFVVIIVVVTLRPSALFGCLVFLLMIPIQAGFAKYVGRFRMRAIAYTDRRVRLMQELITSVKLIKMYAWELPFSKHINAVRKLEAGVLRKAGYMQSTIASVIPSIPMFAGIVSFLSMFAFDQQFTASGTFSILAVYNIMRFMLALGPAGLKSGSEALIALRRLRKFMELPDRSESFPQPANHDVALRINSLDVSWTAVPQPSDVIEAKLKAHAERPAAETKAADAKAAASNAAEASDAATVAVAETTLSEKTALPLSEKTEPPRATLTDVNLVVAKGSLVGICGAVGAGKSSLLSAVLGFMDIKRGSIEVLPDVAYVSQQAWILSDTLRNNILFGEAFDEDNYNKVLDVCSLRADIALLPAGDETEIGERGVNLSGGQRQRISLARAVYRRASLYLLDDPLSAVDAHVGRHIFEKCILGALAGRTVLFVTHQLQYLPQCSRVLFMVDGRVAEDGPYAELMTNKSGFATLMSSMKLEEEPSAADALAQKEGAALDTLEEDLGDAAAEEEEGDGSTEAHKGDDGVQITDLDEVKTEKVQAGQSRERIFSVAQVAAGKSLVKDEAREQGAVSGRTYTAYVRAAGGFTLAFIVLLLFGSGVFAKIFSDYWLSYWIDQGDGTDNPQRNTYALVYGMSAVAMLVVQLIRGVLYNVIVLRASTTMHTRLFYKVICAPMYFFDSTPTGRILNRFSKDLDDVDVQLPMQLEQLVLNGCTMILSIALIGYVYPYFLVACVPIFCLYYYLVSTFKPTQREVKRIDNISRSPVISWLSASLQGLPTLHAYRKEDLFFKEFCKRVDTNARAYYAFYYTTQWFALRLDSVTTLMTGSTALLVVFLRDSVEPSLAALALLYVTSLAGTVQFTTRTSVDVESRFTSVERISIYVDTLPSEAPAEIPETAPPSEWPAYGDIEFEQVSAKYRPELPTVLQSMSCHIRPCEKIGIVGRTGAGKSSLAMVLFRMIEVSEGRIIIDGVDIQKLGLRALRSKLSIIPQDPVLFVGTVRYNVDPFGVHTNDVIWDALERAHIKDRIRSMPAGLEAPVVENGENFSVGERQLICMARALLRGAKILVMDEATAAIDTQTDALIQRTIREAFASCTLLIVAHRLDTIADCDRILVMDAGKVAEFEAPAVLLGRPNSHYGSLVRSSMKAAQRPSQKLSRRRTQTRGTLPRPVAGASSFESLVTLV